MICLWKLREKKNVAQMHFVKITPENFFRRIASIFDVGPQNLTSDAKFTHYTV